LTERKAPGWAKRIDVLEDETALTQQDWALELCKIGIVFGNEERVVVPQSGECSSLAHPWAALVAGRKRTGLVERHAGNLLFARGGGFDNDKTMGIYYGQVGNSFWSYYHGNPPGDSWAAYVEQLGNFTRWLAEHGTDGAILTVTWRATPINSVQRKQLADLLGSKGAGHVIGHALVTDSKAVRALLTALDWFVKKPYTEQVFVDPWGALDWLHSVLPLDRAAILDALLREVPSSQLHPSLACHNSARHG